jgi:hypothetical protein
MVVVQANRGKENAVDQFITKHRDKIVGTISCFDRILFKGHLPLGWPGAMEGFLARKGRLIKDFGRFVNRHSERIKQHARAMAQRWGRPYIHLSGPIRKEDRVQAIRRRDKITDGLVCILAAVEACQSFKLAYGKGKPHLVSARRKCLCLYFYFVDREFGLMHIRITSWFPFMVQVCINGHDWLARKMDRHHIGYRQVDNAFLAIDDPARAQRLADRFVHKNWPRVLSAFARRVNPLMNNLLSGLDYYWVTQQAEYATDVMFRSPVALSGLYDPLLKHATARFGAEDVMTFLGRKLTGNFAGDVGTNYKTRWPGVRVRHRMKENGIKMYNKQGSVLRIETTINRPHEFKVRRRGTRQGRKVMDWFPMPKGVAYLFRYQEVSRAANHRYLNALAVVEDPAPAHQQMHALARPVRHHDRPHRGFNPADREDVRLFAVVMRGEHLLHGFANRDIRSRLFSAVNDPIQSRRQAGRVSRLLKRLHVHALIARIQRTRRWRVTRKGHALMTTILILHHERYPTTLKHQAA